MINLTLNDDTQVEILKHLTVTEKLLGQVSNKLSRSEKLAEIYAMPDLGFASNVRRMHGGFFTGAFYSWDSDTPFIPIDSTINCCGVSVYRIHKEISNKNEFDLLVNRAFEKSKNSSYIWNFNNSNHFIIYGKVTKATGVKDGYYLIMHSSASEFKKQINGLYPTDGNWYSNEIKYENDTKSNRYLRYISGKKAELFVKMAKNLELYNSLRHEYFADSLIGANNIDEIVLNIQHYGMPTSSSICIGSQWHTKPQLYLLLTAPGLPMFFIKPLSNGKNKISTKERDIILTPHGLGMKYVGDPKINYQKDGLEIDNKKYVFDEAVKGKVGMALRSFDKSEMNPKIISDILEKCPGEIVGEVEQIYSYYKGND